MRVLIATGLYPPEIGGPATYTTRLERELPSYDITVSVLPYSRVRGYPKLLRHLAYTWLLFRASRRVDLIHPLDPVSVGVPACLVSLLRRVPYVVRIAGDYAWETAAARDENVVPPHQFATQRQPWRLRVLQWLETRVARRATRVITPSAYLKRVIASWGVPESRITVIYNPGPDPAAYPSKAAARAALGYDETTPLVLSAGRLIPLKRMGAIIESFATVRAAVPDARLAIVGDGPLAAELAQAVQAASLTDAVDLPGRADARAMRHYLAAADVFVLNSSHETFSHLLLEALAAGTPVVAADVGGNPEIVAGERGGVLVPSGEQAALATAITRILTDPAHAAALSDGIPEALAQFQPDTITRTTVDTLTATVS